MAASTSSTPPRSPLGQLIGMGLGWQSLEADLTLTEKTRAHICTHTTRLVFDSVSPWLSVGVCDTKRCVPRNCQYPLSLTQRPIVKQSRSQWSQSTRESPILPHSIHSLTCRCSAALISIHPRPRSAQPEPLKLSAASTIPTSRLIGV